MNLKTDPVLRRLVQEKAPTRYLGAEIAEAEANPLLDYIAVRLVGAPELVIVTGLDLLRAGWKPPPVEPPCPIQAMDVSEP